MFRMIVSLVFIISSTVFSQGLYWETVTTIIGTEGQPLHSKYYHLPGMIMQESVERNSTMIYMLDKHLVYSLNHQKKTFTEKTYYELDRSVQDQRTSIEYKRNLMQEKLQGMSQEDRETTEKMMQDNMANQFWDVPVQVIRTDSVKIINTFRCVKYVVRQGERTLQNLWATSELPDYQIIRNDLLRYSQRIASMNPMIGKSMVEALKNVEGFPIQAEIGGKTAVTVTKVEQRPIPSSAFEIPNDYKKEEAKKNIK